MKKNLLICIILSAAQITLSNIESIQGCLIGAAIGDAMGRVTEFIETTDEIKEMYGKNGVRSFKDFKPEDFIDGKALYTDDTVMSLVVLKSILNKPIKPVTISCVPSIIKNLGSDLANLFGKDKYKIDPYFNYRGHGNTNTSSCKKLLKNPIDPFDLEKYKIFNEDFAHQGGCGSVMRAWSIGLFNFDSNSTIEKLADEQSMLTHKHPMARASSVALAVGINTIISARKADQK